MSKKVYQVGDEPTYSKVDKVYVMNSTENGGGGDGGVADEVAWENVTNKPALFPPEEHNHDDRYNTKEQVSDEINFVRQQMEAGQGRVSANASDEPGYLESKVDNTTVTVDNHELRAKNIEGLAIAPTNINEWLSGTEGNIQTQIDEFAESLVGMVSGMRYRGKEETFEALQQWENKEGGDLVVVLNDETRGGTRSMYIYHGEQLRWDFLGAFTFSDKFTSLQETPESLDGQDGKTLVARGGRVVLENVNYDDLADKPESTITQIDDAVEKRHEHINGELLDTYNQTNADLQTAVSQSHTHSNKSAIDRIGINASGQLTIDGVPYVPAVEPKGYLYARASSTSIATNGTWRWNRTASRGITLRDNGVFVLEEGKTYQITVNASVSSLSDWKRFELIDTETRSSPPEAPNSALVMAVNSSRNEAHSGVLSLIITPTSTRNFGITFTSGANATTATLYGRTSLVITEI